MSTVDDNDLFLAWDGTKSVAIKAGNIIDPPYANYLLLVNRGATSYQTTIDNACRNAQVGDTLLVHRNGASYALDGDEFIVNCCVEPPVVTSAGIIEDPVYRTMVVTNRFATWTDGDNPAHAQYRWWYLKNGGTESNRNDWDVLTTWSDSPDHTVGDIGEQYEKIQTEVRAIDNTGITSRNTMFTAPSGLATAIPPHVTSAGNLQASFQWKGDVARVQNATHDNGTFPATRQYRFFLLIGGSTWTMYRDWSADTTYQTPTTDDLYTEVKAEVRAIDSKGILSDNTMETAALPAANVQPPHVTSAGNISLPTYKGGDARINGASHTNGTRPANREYQWETLKNGVYTIRQSYSTSTTYRTPSQDNSFDGLRVTVRAKDTAGMLSDNTMDTTSGAPPNAPPPIQCGNVSIPGSISIKSAVTISWSGSDPGNKSYTLEYYKGSNKIGSTNGGSNPTIMPNAKCPHTSVGVVTITRDGMTKQCRSNTGTYTDSVIGKPSFTSIPTAPATVPPNSQVKYTGGNFSPKGNDQHDKIEHGIDQLRVLLKGGDPNNVSDTPTVGGSNWDPCDGKPRFRDVSHGIKFVGQVSACNFKGSSQWEKYEYQTMMDTYGRCFNRCSDSGEGQVGENRYTTFPIVRRQY